MKHQIQKQIEWREVNLPEVLWFQEGPGVRKTQFTPEGIKLINVRNLVDGKLDLSNTETFISEDEARGRYSHFLVEEEDFIIASSGIKVDYFYKKMAFATKKNLPLCMNTSTIRFRPHREEEIDMIYIKYLFMTIYFAKQIQFHITGSAQLNFGPSHLSKMKVKLPFSNGKPDIKEQERIVSILEKAERQKERSKRAEELLDEYLKSVFNEMFYDKGFEEVELGRVCEISGKSITPSDLNGSEVYLGLEHIESQTGKILDKPNAKEQNLQSNKFIFNESCVLYGKLRPYLNKIALPNFSGICSTDILPLKPKSDLNKFYLAFLLRGNKFVKQATLASTGANLPRLSPKFLDRFLIPLPPLPFQQKFASIVEKVEKMKESVKKTKQNSEELFNSLMQKAFRGEL